MPESQWYILQKANGEFLQAFRGTDEQANLARVDWQYHFNFNVSVNCRLANNSERDQTWIRDGNKNPPDNVPF